jgi:diguanylate cyclase (GGDEF)-like protein
MSLYLPICFLLLQFGILALVPSIAGPAAYIFMVIAPLLAAAAAFWRGRSESTAARFGWYAVVLALVVWAAGAFDNLWQELILNRRNEMYRDSILAFNLAVVPITFLLASDWRLNGRWLVRAIDALVALALGASYFQYTWTMINDHATPAQVGVAYLVWLLDVQNLYIVSCALVRWYIAEEPEERDLFRALSVYSTIYFAIVFVNDHYFAGNPSFGPEYSTIVTLAFAVLSAFALRRPSALQVRPANPALVRAVRSGSPILLAAALLIASLFLIRVDYVFGTAGVLIAVLGIGMRTTVTQVRQIEHGEALQRERSALQTIAWTDALTGVPNRHFFARALRRAWRGERRVDQPQAILMIDIDHFKQLNDRYGHPAGDACLRKVARALQRALVRPDDVLARYGGEEFIALLRDTDAAGAQVVGERLRAAVENLRIKNEGCPQRVVTVSVGAASAALSGQAAATSLVEKADRALYEAKCAGRNLVKLVTTTTPK